MKKLAALFCGVGLLLSFVVSSCGGGNTKAEKEEQKEWPTPPKNYIGEFANSLREKDTTASSLPRWKNYLPVDSARRTVYDDYLIEKYPMFAGRSRCNYSYYLFFQDTLTAAFETNFSINCYEYNDTSLCYLSAPFLKQIIVSTPKRLSILNFVHISGDSLNFFYKNIVNKIDTLRKFVTLSNRIPIAEYDDSGISEEYRYKTWRTDLKVSYTPKGIRFKNANGKGFSFTLSPPVSGNKRRNTTSWRGKLPPFVIYDFHTLSRIFWYKGEREYPEINMQQYFE